MKNHQKHIHLLLLIASRQLDICMINTIFKKRNRAHIQSYVHSIRNIITFKEKIYLKRKKEYCINELVQFIT